VFQGRKKAKVPKKGGDQSGERKVLTSLHLRKERRKDLRLTEIQEGRERKGGSDFSREKLRQFYVFEKGGLERDYPGETTMGGEKLVGDEESSITPSEEEGVGIKDK